ncbi:CcoQ/FixQ family Cbb3-type cytochrome c oxidase assembly chaperone [Pontibacterium sp. N1Y112]|uniref:CcoQ/FixQ family Cbb3-type cytochrome c oxidase assembly chaperone n=1 Tax=Pontibacterium sinense TaxID=2781979 RepID=A0A8J7JZ21_9GAMM|nr:CcoQ/FixQ family Cbb3-type cytochrome c oxidase assembly chaperone [Pontibacterium sinense]MBE9398238.1 CcoQ/FixQ family Cbb3-type cytochrome c oxidase assembly chaperone [Pontibacterium sinense]
MLITFLALFVWVLHPKNTSKFNDAANLPFADRNEGAAVQIDNRRRTK